jgi:hypothetical protein
MRLRPLQPLWRARDRLVLSKGHACPALYAALALRGYFPRSEFRSFRLLGGLLHGHPDVETPGVDAPSRSLGMGLSQGLGMALGGRYQSLEFRTFVTLGDGDMQEGNTWEDTRGSRRALRCRHAGDRRGRSPSARPPFVSKCCLCAGALINPTTLDPRAPADKRRGPAPGVGAGPR